MRLEYAHRSELIEARGGMDDGMVEAVNLKKQCSMISTSGTL